MFSAREGEKSLICQERKTSYFCEALREELIANSNNLWPPSMEVIVSNLKERFEELRKQGKVEQIPIRRVDVQTWDGDRYPLFEKDSSDLLANVRKTANAAREALEPRYLQRISRQVVQEKYLPAIQRSIEGEARVIFIYAPAGYGKSVILGEIYDQLIQSRNSWVALTLCAYLSRKSIDSIQSLAEVLGESVCFKKEPIDEIALTLSDRYSHRGVLLIDTLDLILNSDLLPNLRGVLLKLLNVGVTVVFTCREEEYKFLRSSDANLGGIKLDHHKVAEFTKKEVEEAALKFIEKKKEAKREENKEQEVNDQIFTNFADQIFNIAAGEYQASELHKIIHNPLLLGMLCELFAEKGNVPPDLTVSNLYDKYWDEKVYNHRLLGEKSFEAEQKQRLCLAIAKGFFNIFRDTLTFNESAEKYDLGIDWHKDFIAAFQDLVTEGVLETLPTNKNQIRFFHQTLLEYAIARWLKLREAQLSLNELLDDLKQIDWAYSQLYWYTIIRQILTIATNSKFEDIVKQLEIRKQQPAFRAIVFAAASRDEPSALQNLLPLALELESSHQEALRQAVVSASVKLADSAYNIMLGFMQKGKIKPAVNAAQTAGAMLARWWSSLSPRLEETLEAISKRTILHEKNKLSPEHSSDIFGWFFQQFKSILEQTVDINALRSLRKYYYLAGYKNLSFLIQLHLRLEVPKEERRQLLNLLVRESIPNKLQIKEDIENLLEDVLPDLVKPEELVQWGSWLAALDPSLEELPKGWDEVQGKIVGRLVSNKLELLKEILKNAFENTQSNIYCNIQAIETAVQRGGSSSVATILLSTNIEAIPPERYGSLDKLLRNTASYFSLDNQEAIARWLEPVARNSPEKFIPALDALADNSPFARQLYAELIPKLPSKQQAYQQARLLRFCPIEQHPPLTGFDQKSQLFLVALYRQHAKTSTQALQKLLEVVRGIISAKVVYQDVVYQALEDIETLAIGRLGIKDWLPLLRAEFPKARIKSLEAISQMKQELTDTELTEICSALATEDNQQVVIRLCKLVKLWVNTNKRVPLNVTEAICGIPSRLSQKNTFDGGVAEVLIPTITAIAQSNEQTLIPQQLVEDPVRARKNINRPKMSLVAGFEPISR